MGEAVASLPGREIFTGAACELRLALGAPGALLSLAQTGRHRQLGKQTEVDIHWLEGSRACRAGDMAQQRTQRRGRRRCIEHAAEPLESREEAREQTDGGALDIAFDAG